MKPPAEPPVMALLYSKEDCMDEASGEFTAVKKVKAKKRRLDNGAAEKQTKVNYSIESEVLQIKTPSFF